MTIPKRGAGGRFVPGAARIKICKYCGAEFTRKHYENGGRENWSTFEKRGWCNDYECVTRARDDAARKAWAARHPRSSHKIETVAGFQVVPPRQTEYEQAAHRQNKEFIRPPCFDCSNKCGPGVACGAYFVYDMHQETIDPATFVEPTSNKTRWERRPFQVAKPSPYWGKRCGV